MCYLYWKLRVFLKGKIQQKNAERGNFLYIYERKNSTKKC